VPNVRKYVLMGAQGSGKGTQAALLARDLDLTQISVGDILRWHVQNHTKLGAQVRRVMAAGELVGDDLVETVVNERLGQHDWNYGFVIDGFPRNRRQAEFFLESYDIDAVIHLALPDEDVRRRVLARRLCSSCGLDYNLMAHRPEVLDRCDVCGAPLVARDDDHPEALAARLRDYREKTEPVIGLFRRKEFVVELDATNSVETIQVELRRRLGLPAGHLGDVPPAQPLSDSL
jgi:adenylate kinase